MQNQKFNNKVQTGSAIKDLKKDRKIEQKKYIVPSKIFRFIL